MICCAKALTSPVEKRPSYDLPKTSGIAELFAAIIGFFATIASNKTSPNPSYLLGKINKKEGVEEDQKEEKIESKEKHHKSKDKCAICIRRRAKREQERLQ